jgi:DNA mismatch repair protein MutS
MPTVFHSILEPRARPAPPAEQPEFFRDLNLDQIVASATAGREAYDLTPFFHRPLDDPDVILYRQEVMRDLEDRALYERIGAFAAAMQEMRRHLRAAGESHNRLSQWRWFLDAAAIYCGAVRRLTDGLAEGAPRSRGFRGLAEHLRRYAGSAAFRELYADAERVAAELGAVRYCIRIRGGAVTVTRYEDEADYSAEIEATFAKFRQGAVKDYSTKFSEFAGMNHVEAQIVELVAKLYPDVFRGLGEFCGRHEDFLEPTIAAFDREVQFYLAYLQYIGTLRHAGLPFCYPQVSRQTKAEHGSDVFDLALADKRVAEGAAIVLNDFRLDGDERVLVVSGPNQGGKTTFARTFGQLHYLASLGCPVPGRSARLFLCDRIFTHFEKEEKVENLRGKLQDDMLRIHRVLAEATPDSLIVMNEIFSSTALEDAVFLATEIMRRILERGCLAVCVTFLDELAGLSDSVVSMVGTVVPENPAQRTFKIVRRPADGRAYAMAIAEKYRLGYRSVMERLNP